MNQNLRYIDINRVFFFGIYCQRGRSLLSYLTELFLITKRDKFYGEMSKRENKLGRRLL